MIRFLVKYAAANMFGQQRYYWYKNIGKPSDYRVGRNKFVAFFVTHVTVIAKRF